MGFYFTLQAEYSLHSPLSLLPKHESDPLRGTDLLEAVQPASRGASAEPPFLSPWVAIPGGHRPLSVGRQAVAMPSMFDSQIREVAVVDLITEYV